MKIVWYRNDFITNQSNAINSYFNARIAVINCMRKRNIDAKLIIHSYPQNYINDSELAQFLIQIPCFGKRKILTLTKQMTLFFYCLALLIFKTPDYFVTDDQGLFPMLILSCIAKLFFIRCEFCLDMRSVPVEVNPKDQNRISKTVKRIIYKLSIAQFSKFTFITEGLKENIEDSFQIKFPNSGFWSSGVDTVLFKPKADLSDICENFTLIYHGSISKTRGLDDLLASVALCLPSIPKLRLIILGFDSDRVVSQPFLKEILQKITDLSLQNNVELIKPVPQKQVPEVLTRADVGIVPIRNMPWWNGQSPLKLMEYMACGLATICTDIDMNKRILSNEDFAVFCKPNDPKSLCDSITMLYQEKMNSEEKFALRGEKARSFVENEYSWEEQTERLTNYLGIS